LVACHLSGKRAEFYLVIGGLSSEHLQHFQDLRAPVGIVKKAGGSLLTFVCFQTTILACSKTFMECGSLLLDTAGIMLLDSKGMNNV
jgi:hypothetical protein